MDARTPERGDHRGVAAPVAREGLDHSLALRRPPTEQGHTHLGAGLIDEDEQGGVPGARLLAPGGAGRLIAFGRRADFF
jgi:hypothetical protein